jgi:hypothetical protein
MSDKLKFCKDCVNYEENSRLKMTVCHKYISLITGEVRGELTDDVRHSLCGKEKPRFFEQRAEEETEKK